MDAYREPRRGNWRPECDFFFSCFTFTLSTHLLWATPFLLLTHGINGGVILTMVSFILCTMFVMYPLMYLEISLGQFCSRGMPTIWNCSPIFKGLGFSALILIVFGSYYNIVSGAWALYYLAITVLSNDTFPWSSCDNSWNTARCHHSSSSAPRIVRNPSIDSTAAMEYFNSLFLAGASIEDIGKIDYGFLVSLGVTWVLVYLALIVGHFSMGKMAMVTTFLTTSMLLALVIRSATLPGALEGMSRAISLSRFDMTAGNIIDAAWRGFVASFFQFQPMSGVYAMLSSYNKPTRNFYRDSAIMIIFSTLLPLLACIFVTSFAGYHAKINDSLRTDTMLYHSSSSYVFAALPDILSTLPMPKIWLCLHFVLIIMLMLGPQMLIVEVLVTSIADGTFPDRWGRRTRMAYKSVLAFSTCVVLCSAGTLLVSKGGMHVYLLLETTVWMVTPFFLCLLSSVAVAWGYGLSNYAFDVKIMLGRKPNYFILGCILVMTPLVTLAFLITHLMRQDPTVALSLITKHDPIPQWLVAVAYLLALVPLLMVPLFALVHLLWITLCQKRQLVNRSWFRRILDPSPDWSHDEKTQDVPMPTPPIGGRAVLPLQSRMLTGRRPNPYGGSYRETKT